MKLIVGLLFSVIVGTPLTILVIDFWWQALAHKGFTQPEEPKPIIHMDFP